MFRGLGWCLRGRGLKSYALPFGSAFSRSFFALASETPHSLNMSAVAPSTANAFTDLDDAVANFQHRLQRLHRKESTPNSVRSALDAIGPAAVCPISPFLYLARLIPSFH